MNSAGAPIVHPRVSVNPMAMLGRPYEEEYPALVDAGARRIGLAGRKLDERGWSEGVEGARRAGLEVEYLVHGIFAAVDDDMGWRTERTLLDRAVDTAAAQGARIIYLCSGGPGELRFEEAVDALARRLQPVAERASRLGVRLALENQMSVRTDCGFVFTLRDTLAVARRIGIGVCADLYCCWIEPGLADTLADAGEELLLVQVSDRDRRSLVQPDRRVPGDGNLPLDRMVADVVTTGYRGLFDLELLGPEIEREGPARAVRRGLEWLSAALERAGVPADGPTENEGRP